MGVVNDVVRANAMKPSPTFNSATIISGWNKHLSYTHKHTHTHSNKHTHSLSLSLSLTHTHYLSFSNKIKDWENYVKIVATDREQKKI